MAQNQEGVDSRSRPMESGAPSSSFAALRIEQTQDTTSPLDDSSTANAPSPETPTPETATSYLTSLLDRPLRVTLKDDRTVIGRLYVIDGGGNMILSEAEEFSANLAELFEVNRAQAKGGINADEEEELYWRSEKVREEIMERWEGGEKWLPKSEPLGGPGTGWGGRGLGLVLAKLEDCKMIELLDEAESGEERNEATTGNLGEGEQAQGMDWSQGVI